MAEEGAHGIGGRQELNFGPATVHRLIKSATAPQASIGGEQQIQDARKFLVDEVSGRIPASISSIVNRRSNGMTMSRCSKPYEEV